MTGQYMKSKNELTLGLIGIDNTVHVRDIVAMHESLFHYTIVSTHEDDYEWISK